MNNSFISQTLRVEKKITEIDNALTLLAERAQYAGHENYMIPKLLNVLMITKQTFEKMNTEAARLGIIKRKLVTPDAKEDQSIAQYAKMIELQFKVCAKLFRAVLKFGRTHLNDSY